MDARSHRPGVGEATLHAKKHGLACLVCLVGGIGPVHADDKAADAGHPMLVKLRDSRAPSPMPRSEIELARRPATPCFASRMLYASPTESPPHSDRIPAAQPRACRRRMNAQDALDRLWPKTTAPHQVPPLLFAAGRLPFPALNAHRALGLPFPSRGKFRENSCRYGIRQRGGGGLIVRENGSFSTRLESIVCSGAVHFLRGASFDS